MESERLGLPDEVLELAVRLPGGASCRQRPLRQPQVGDELSSRRIGQARPASGAPSGVGSRVVGLRQPRRLHPLGA